MATGGGVKRGQDFQSEESSCKRQNISTKIEDCIFGENCCRRNPHHFREYSHKHLLDLCIKYGNDLPNKDELKNFEAGSDAILDQLKIYKDVCKKTIEEAIKTSKSNKSESSSGEDKKSNILKKLESAQPFSYFLTKVKDEPFTHNDPRSIYIAELLHPSLGKLKRSVQITFMVEWDWLSMNYEVNKVEDKPMLIIYGDENPEMSKSNLPDNVRAIKVKPRFPFGTHHTKLMIFQYEDDSIRVVMTTANLVGSDWENRTQGVWVSPLCAKISNPKENSGESPTQFKASFLRYLEFYGLSPLRSYIDAVKACDFSKVNVFFISSVPNSHKGANLNQWGHRQVSSILKKHIPEEVQNWPLILQCSSIGSLGPDSDSWLKSDIGNSFLTTKKFGSPLSVPFSLIYPSKKDVFNSHDGIFGGGCLPYSKMTHNKQPWMNEILYRWKSDTVKRTKAMPHIKSYTRINANHSKAAFFLLTSANLSKTAWGITSKKKDSFQIQSYEAGVLFLPKFVTGEDHFKLGSNKNELQLPYDVPLQKYDSKQTVWFMDYLREAMA